MMTLEEMEKRQEVLHEEFEKTKRICYEHYIKMGQLSEEYNKLDEEIKKLKNK